jgi:VWFA-related protein
MRSGSSRLAVGTLLGCLVLRAGQEEPLIRADVNVVVLHATVKDGRNRFVHGLSRDAFKVTEDGVPQQISFFSSEEVPVAVGLVIDESGSMMRRRPDVITGALSFIAASHPKDEMFVVNFNEAAKTGLPDGRPFSSSAPELRDALMSMEPAGQTALYDGIMLGLRHLDQATLSKKVLLVVSDGADNRSRHTLEDVVKLADRNGVILYTVGLFDQTSDDKNPGVLRRLARQTGGSVYLPDDLSEMKRICAEIAQDVRNQYAVGYASGNAKLDGAYRRVALTAVDDKGKALKVRTRTGYFGAKEREPAVKETGQPALPAPK